MIETIISILLLAGVVIAIKFVRSPATNTSPPTALAKCALVSKTERRAHSDRADLAFALADLTCERQATECTDRLLEIELIEVLLVSEYQTTGHRARAHISD